MVDAYHSYLSSLFIFFRRSCTPDGRAQCTSNIHQLAPSAKLFSSVTNRLQVSYVVFIVRRFIFFLFFFFFTTAPNVSRQTKFEIRECFCRRLKRAYTERAASVDLFFAEKKILALEQPKQNPKKGFSPSRITTMNKNAITASRYADLFLSVRVQSLNTTRKED